MGDWASIPVLAVPDVTSPTRDLISTCNSWPGSPKHGRTWLFTWSEYDEPTSLRT